MKLVAQTSQFRVYDDILSERDFRALWHPAGDHVRCTIAGFFHRPLT